MASPISFCHNPEVSVGGDLIPEEGFVKTNQLQGTASGVEKPHDGARLRLILFLEVIRMVVDVTQNAVNCAWQASKLVSAQGTCGKVKISEQDARQCVFVSALEFRVD